MQVPAAQLWTFLIGQVAFLVWMIALARMQVPGGWLRPFMPCSSQPSAWAEIKRAALYCSFERQSSFSSMGQLGGACQPCADAATANCKCPLLHSHLVQLAAMHKVDARVVTASDYSVLITHLNPGSVTDK